MVELLHQHDQAVDPNLLQLAESWKQVEAALAAQGKALPVTAAANDAGEGDDEEQETPAAAADGGNTAVVAEDLQVRVSSCSGGSSTRAEAEFMHVVCTAGEMALLLQTHATC